MLPYDNLHALGRQTATESPDLFVSMNVMWPFCVWQSTSPLTIRCSNEWYQWLYACHLVFNTTLLLYIVAKLHLNRPTETPFGPLSKHLSSESTFASVVCIWTLSLSHQLILPPIHPFHVFDIHAPIPDPPQRWNHVAWQRSRRWGPPSSHDQSRCDAGNYVSTCTRSCRPCERKGCIKSSHTCDINPLSFLEPTESSNGQCVSIILSSEQSFFNVFAFVAKKQNLSMKVKFTITVFTLTNLLFLVGQMPLWRHHCGYGWRLSPEWTQDLAFKTTSHPARETRRSSFDKADFWVLLLRSRVVGASSHHPATESSPLLFS